jgi:hypothetical protein
VKVEKAQVEKYGVYLKDKSRPPSRGGNKRAWHQHVIAIRGERYAFLAAWSGKFVFKGETVSFDWEWDETNNYRNINVGSVVAFSDDGKHKVRGERGSKVWRSADMRPPGRRSDW